MLVNLYIFTKVQFCYDLAFSKVIHKLCTCIDQLLEGLQENVSFFSIFPCIFKFYFREGRRTHEGDRQWEKR